MNNVNVGIGSGQGADDENIIRDREDAGLAALESLSLEQLAAIASKEIGDSRQLQAEAVGLARRSTVTFYRAGRALWCARKKLKGKGKRAWTKWQKDNGIPITSAWQAIRLYEEAEAKGEGEEAIAGLTRTQALKKYGITKPKKAQPQPDPTPAEVGTALVPVGQAPIEAAPAESPDLREIAERNVGTTVEPTIQDMTEEGEAEEEQEPQADPTTPPATETLLIIARRLETLERDFRGGDLGDEAHALIDRAIATLLRLKGDADPVAEAA